MINPQSQLDQLKRNLESQGVPADTASHIVRLAANDINSALIDLAYDVLGEVEQLGIASKSKDFLADLALNISPSNISVDTMSGRRDFSEPAFPMLPRLLKNAKIAKDGSRYKVIPIKQKSISPSGLIEASLMLNKLNEAKRQSLKDQAKGNGQLPSTMMTSGTSGAFLDKRKEIQSVTGINFRTVSSKQNPETQWVNPGKNFDASKELHQANSELQSRATEIINDIIAMYEGAV